MDKRFKLHIKWSNLIKTEGIAELSDNGQPLLKTECIEDARLLQTILNELDSENKELKFQLIECGEHKLYSRRKLEEENKELKKKLESKQRLINAYENYIETLKEDGVLDD